MAARSNVGIADAPAATLAADVSGPAMTSAVPAVKESVPAITCKGKAPPVEGEAGHLQVQALQEWNLVAAGDETTFEAASSRKG